MFNMSPPFTILQTPKIVVSKYLVNDAFSSTRQVSWTSRRLRFFGGQVVVRACGDFHGLASYVDSMECQAAYVARLAYGLTWPTWLLEHFARLA